MIPISIITKQFSTRIPDKSYNHVADGVHIQITHQKLSSYITYNHTTIVMLNDVVSNTLQFTLGQYDNDDILIKFLNDVLGVLHLWAYLPMKLRIVKLKSGKWLEENKNLIKPIEFDETIVVRDFQNFCTDLGKAYIKYVSPDIPLTFNDCLGVL